MEDLTKQTPKQLNTQAIKKKSFLNLFILRLALILPQSVLGTMRLVNERDIYLVDPKSAEICVWMGRMKRSLSFPLGATLLLLLHGENPGVLRG